MWFDLKIKKCDINNRTAYNRNLCIFEFETLAEIEIGYYHINGSKEMCFCNTIETKFISNVASFINIFWATL